MRRKIDGGSKSFQMGKVALRILFVLAQRGQGACAPWPSSAQATLAAQATFSQLTHCAPLLHLNTTMNSTFGSYKDVEHRIQLYISQNPDLKRVKVAELARDFHVPYRRLMSQYNNVASRSNRPRTNQRLNNS